MGGEPRTSFGLARLNTLSRKRQFHFGPFSIQQLVSYVALTDVELKHSEVTFFVPKARAVIVI